MRRCAEPSWSWLAESSTPRSNNARDFSSVRSPSSSCLRFLEPAIADSKSLMACASVAVTDRSTRDAAAELALGQPHANGVAGRDRAARPNNTRPAAFQRRHIRGRHRQRAQRVNRPASSRTGRRPQAPARRRSRSFIGLDEPRPHLAATRRDIAPLEPAAGRSNRCPGARGGPRPRVEPKRVLAIPIAQGDAGQRRSLPSTRSAACARVPTIAAPGVPTAVRRDGSASGSSRHVRPRSAALEAAWPRGHRRRNRRSEIHLVADREITGTALHDGAPAPSLKAHKSSEDPPPRPMMTTSSSGRWRSRAGRAPIGGRAVACTRAAR